MPYTYYKFDNLPKRPPTKEELYEAIYNEFKKFIDIDDNYRHFFTTLVLLTYQHENFYSVPYSLITGDTGSGKTTALTILGQLCYRPLFGVSIPSADIFTYLGQFDENSPGTIIEDEAQGLEKDLEKLKIYKSGYRRGAKVPRMLPQNRNIVFYPCYGVKILGSEDIVEDKGFQRRIIIVRMTEGNPEEILTQTLKDNPTYFSDLRNKLLAWRVAGWPNGKENKPIKLPKILGDLIDLWEPLVQTAQNTRGYKPILNLLKQAVLTKYKQYAYSVEGFLARILNEYYLAREPPRLPIPFKLIWNEFVRRTNAELLPNRKSVYVADIGEISQIIVAKKIRVIFGGKRKTVPVPLPDNSYTTEVAYEFDPEKLEKAVKRYLKWDIIHEKLTEI